MAITEKKSSVDVYAKGLAEEVLGLQVSQHINLKAFCVIDPGLEAKVIEGCIEDIKRVKNEDRFYEPCKMFVDGLLGSFGSSEIAELDLLDATERRSHGENLEALDWELCEYERLAFPYFPVEVATRTGSILHESGDNEGSNAIDDFEVAKWLTSFVHHKIMCIWFLGPETGELELTPFDDESATTRIIGEPGTLVILRPECLSHIFNSNRGTSYCMTSFYLSDGVKSKYKEDPDDIMTPCAEALDEYAFNRVEQVREKYEDDDPQRPRLPRHWELIGSHQGNIAQQISLRTASIRYPGSWDHTAWSKALHAGVDYAEQVPITRWDHDKFFDDYETTNDDVEVHQNYVNKKTNTKHGAFIDGADLFDGKFFRLSNAEAGGMDPGQRLILESGYEAMYADGLRQKTLMNSRGGVFVGAGPVEWCQVPKESGGVCGAGNSISCGRVSFTFGMKGPCISVELGNASSLAILNEACTLLSFGRGKWEPPPFGMVSCYHLQLSPIVFYQLTCVGVLSRTGRTLAFEASADGYVRMDNNTSVILRNSMKVVDGEPVLEDDYDKRIGTISGNSILQAGKRASLLAPDAATWQEAAILAQRAAQISPLDVDGVEMHAVGNILHDAMETASVTRAYRPDGMIGIADTGPFGMMSVKPSGADGVEGASLVQVLKIMWGLRFGLQQPTGHMRLLNPHIDFQVCERPVNLTTELMEYRLDTAFCGVSASSYAGCHAHVICFGQMDRNLVPEMSAGQDIKPKQILYWPSGGGELKGDQVPSKGYFIAGSWSKFQAEEMEKEANGVYGFTITLGENRWEHFQIWLDGKKNKALHPGELKAAKGASVQGPEDALLFNTWMIDGRPLPMYKEGAPDEHWDDGGQYYDFAGEDTGEVGDQYRVRLKLAGKYRTVEWTKLNEQKPDEVPKGKYYVMGTWNDLVAEEMTCDSQEEGRYSIEVTLPEAGADFLISRNEDWMQVIYPSTNAWGQTTQLAVGPESMQMSSTWHINGRKLDTFRIEFFRDEMTVTWKKVAKVELAPEIVAKKAMPAYHLSGSWDNFNSAHRMLWSGKAQAYQAYAELGSSARLDFRVLQDGNFTASMYPSVEHAGMNDGDIVGPGVPSDPKLCWSIGKDDDFGGRTDRAEKGARYLISVTLTKDNTKVKKVDWALTDGSKAPLEDATARGMFVYGK